MSDFIFYDLTRNITILQSFFDIKIIKTSNCMTYFYWTLDVSRTVTYEVTLVRLSVGLYVSLSVLPSLSFLKSRSLVLSDIVHDDS